MGGKANPQDSASKLEAPIAGKKITFFSLVDEYLATHKLSESRVKHFNVLVRMLKRYELFRRLSNKRFVLDVHTMTPVTLDDIGSFMMSEPQIFDEHPELYDEVPYARSKVRKNICLSNAAPIPTRRARRSFPVVRGSAA